MLYYCKFCLAQLIHVVIYLLIVATWIVEIFWVKFAWRVGGLSNPSGPLPIFHHTPSYAQTTKSKLGPSKNPNDMHIHDSLWNVATHMPCAKIHRIRHYRLEIVFVRAHICTHFRLQWVMITAFSCLCSKINRHM